MRFGDYKRQIPRSPQVLSQGRHADNVSRAKGPIFELDDVRITPYVAQFGGTAYQITSISVSEQYKRKDSVGWLYSCSYWVWGYSLLHFSGLETKHRQTLTFL